MLSRYILMPFLASNAIAFKPCPLGPVFEPPTNLSTNSAFQNGLNALKQALDSTKTTGSSPYGDWWPSNNSFSVGIFDATTPGQLFSYEYSSPVLQKSNQGVKHVTEDSIYRMGSGSKLITAYLFMIEVGPKYWNHKITEYVPELEEASKKCSALSDPVDCIDWSDITLGSLASHMAGIPRDYSTIADLLSPVTLGEDAAVEAGFPPLPKSAYEPCALGETDPCPKKPYLQGLASEQPIFAPFTTPIYSNAGYEVLSFALEKITGRSIEDMLQNDLFDKLNMTRSSYAAPKSLDNAVIPLGVQSGFPISLGPEQVAGGFYSSQSDLSKLGQSILASTLLKPSITRQWMKPVAFTSSMRQGIGMPWEIWRVPNLTDHVLDLYTKAGDVLTYSSYLVLSPDYNVGFIVLAAGNYTTKVVEVLGDTIAATIFPTLENAARDQAQAKYAGTYESPDKSVDSSITLKTQTGQPGLIVEKWVSNGTNIQLPLKMFLKVHDSVDIRLYPTDLVQRNGSNSERVAYRAVFEPLNTKPDGGVLDPVCTTFDTVDSPVYGNIGIDEFVFHLEDGEVTGLSPRAFRITLKKTG